jgi:hypothetical protein
MSEPFKFSGAATPQTPVAVESKPVVLGSPEERISAARAKCLDINRQNAKSNPGMPQLSPEHFQDTGHGSAWLAKHLLFLATELQTTVEGRRIPLGASGTFSPKTGKFPDLGFNLSDLSKALHARIQELGISMAKLEEWAATPHSLQANREYYSMTFDERCALWKEPS